MPERPPNKDVDENLAFAADEAWLPKPSANPECIATSDQDSMTCILDEADTRAIVPTQGVRVLLTFRPSASTQFPHSRFEK